jgi:dynein heavy chain
MDETNKNVAELNVIISKSKIEADKAKADTAKILIEVEEGTKIANVESTKANKIAEEADKILDAASIVQARADAAFKRAVPAMKAAEQAVENLQVSDIGDFKALSKGPERAMPVCEALNYISQPLKNKSKFLDWKFNKELMNNPKKFKDKLIDISADIKANTDD